MVALKSSRRLGVQHYPLTPDALAANRDQALAAGLAVSRRRGAPLAIIYGLGGAIDRVRIGPWRWISAGPHRRIAEVKSLPSDCVAVRIERLGEGSDRPSSEIWQLYDLQGRLEASMQTSSNGKFAVLTDYSSRQSCRFVRNGQDELETAETWNI
jgi:hypothetical protein